MPLEEIDKISGLIKYEKQIIEDSEAKIETAKKKLNQISTYLYENEGSQDRGGNLEKKDNWTVPIILIAIIFILLLGFSLFFYLYKPGKEYVPLPIPIEKVVVFNNTNTIIKKPIMNTIEQKIYEKQIIKADIKSDLLCIANYPIGKFTCYPKNQTIRGTSR